MKKHVILFVIVLFWGSAQGQQQKIEDFRHIYMPDPDGVLTGFVPAGFTKISHIEALEVIDAFFMDFLGKKAREGYTGPEVNYYRKGNVVMSCGIYNDSLKWKLTQDIQPQGLIAPPGDPDVPQVVQTVPRYRNPYSRIRTPYMTEGYLWSYFEIKDNGVLLPGLSSEYRSNNTLDVAYAYPNSNPMRMYPVLVAFDKEYRWKAEVRVFSANAHRIEAVEALKWIATHMEIGSVLPN